MGQSMLLPAGVILVGAAVALFFAKPQAGQGLGSAGARGGGQEAGGSAKVDAGLDSAS